MVPYVLIHGGGHGAWCWDALRPHLDAPSLAVDLPGRPGNPADVATLRIRDFVASVVDDIERCGYDDVILVGHSIAGVTLPAVADLLGPRVRHMVFVACAVPPQGGRIVDTIAPTLRWLCLRAVRRGSRQLVFPRWLTSYLFCNDLDAETTRLVLDRLTPEAMGVTVEPITRGPASAAVSRTYVKLLSDRTIRPARQDTMITNLGDASVRELDAGHDAMLSRPRELAEHISAAARAAML